MIIFKDALVGDEIWFFEEDWTPESKGSPVAKGEIVKIERHEVESKNGNTYERKFEVENFIDDITFDKREHQLFHSRKGAMEAAQQFFDSKIHFAEIKLMQLKTARENIDLFTEEEED